MKLTVSWLSAGVSSFIATYLLKDEIDEIYYIHINDQEEDTLRFIKDCEKAIGKPITILQSEYCKTVQDAVLSFGGFRNAITKHYPCTNILKKRVRKDQFEALHKNDEITYVWGFDCDEKHRAERVMDAMPQFEHRFPCIERNLSKDDLHAICNRLGVKRPRMYDMGYQNNNCIGCVRGGAAYWNRIRKDFPEVFKARAELERKVGNSILKDCYLDELDPEKGYDKREIMEECGIFCEMTLSEIIRGKNERQ